MKKFQFRLNKQKFEVSSQKITGREILQIGGLLPEEDYELLIRKNRKGFEPIQLDESVDLREPGIEGFLAKPYSKIIITVDNEPVEIDEVFSTPIEILTLVKKDPDKYFLSQLIGDREIGYKNDPNHKIRIKGGQIFFTHQLNDEITIYVNATPEIWKGNTISFEQVVKLAFENPPYGVNTEYQVVYSLPKGGKEGTLAAGQTIKIKDGTEFDVSATDKS